MAPLTIKSALRATRSVVKKATYTRRELSSLSKSEENGTQGAAEERERLSEDWTRRVSEAERLTAQTEAASDRFARVGLALRHGEAPGTNDPLVQLAARTARMGAPVAPLIDMADHASKEARIAATSARDKLDQASDDIAATSALIPVLDRLPSVGFDMNHKTVKRLRTHYLHHTQALGQKRKST